MVLPLASLNGTAVARWWLATMCKVAHAVEQRRLTVSDGEEEKWEKPPPTLPTRGIMLASPRGTAVTGGVWSPSHHRAQCHARSIVLAG
jgi:hypothetical protein